MIGREVADGSLDGDKENGRAVEALRAAARVVWKANRSVGGPESLVGPGSEVGGGLDADTARTVPLGDKFERSILSIFCAAELKDRRTAVGVVAAQVTLAVPPGTSAERPWILASRNTAKTNRQICTSR
jgi:hypothetical protein